MCFNIDLSSWRLVLELVHREDVSHCNALLLRTFLGFDLRLVRLILVSVFRSSPGLPVNCRLRTNLDVCFDSLQLVTFPLESPGTSSQVSVALPRQLL